MDIKAVFSQYTSASVQAFLGSGAKLVLPTSKQPRVTILLILYNRAELTFLCLRCLYENLLQVPSEVIIIDNNSTDQTSRLLDKIEGARIILNKENIFYSAAVNQGLRAANSDYVLLLNNDAQLIPGSVQAALNAIQAAPSNDVGAVCGKILLLDGSLQEAGSIIWSDGACLGYGRGDNPDAPMYMFRRDVDYGSGAILLVNRQIFLTLDGFDAEAYAPAYYEETDFCARLWQNNYRVVYEPRAIAIHYEFASQENSQSALTLQAEKRDVFVQKNYDWLQSQPPSSQSSNPLFARSHRKRSRILFIDDRIPHPWRGVGLPRCNKIINTLCKLDYEVTFYPIKLEAGNTWDNIYSTIPQEVEVMFDEAYGENGLAKFLLERQGYYETIFVSRPHNIEILNAVLDKHPDLVVAKKLIYDAEAIFSNRDLQRLKLKNIQVSEAEAKSMVAKEMALAARANSITCVSETEKQNFLDYGFSNVNVIGHCLPLQLTERPFEDRENILFVGAVDDDYSPNGDALLWFLQDIFHLIREKLRREVKLLFAGFNQGKQVSALVNDRFQSLGVVDDLSELYSSCKLFVVPTRFAAGVPHKVHESASRGLPIVATSLIASQVGWEHESELLVADTALDFANCCVRLYEDKPLWETLRKNAARRILTECSEESFEAGLIEVLSSEV